MEVEKARKVPLNENGTNQHGAELDFIHLGCGALSINTLGSDSLPEFLNIGPNARHLKTLNHQIERVCFYKVSSLIEMDKVELRCMIRLRMTGMLILLGLQKENQ